MVSESNSNDYDTHPNQITFGDLVCLLDAESVIK